VELLLRAAHTLPDLTKAEVSYLTNKDIIAVDQDALCEQATLVSQNEDGAIDVLTKNLANGDRLLTILNHDNSTHTATVSLERLGIDPEQSYRAKDLWTGKTSTVREELHVKLAKHQTAIYRVSGSPKKALKVTPTGQIFNTFSLNCLSASASPHHGSSDVKFAACEGEDEQVWQVSAQGLVSSLAHSKTCLAVDGSDVSLEPCDAKQKAQKWSYGTSGNLVSKVRGLCLTESSRGSVGVKKCGRALDSQVVALPGGVKLVD
jgi:alpha-galactosidase